MPRLVRALSAPVALCGLLLGLSLSRAHAQSRSPERPSAPAVEVSVTSTQATKAQRIRESSQAVTVVELDRAKQQSADLGEVLARVQGIHLRRQGGLGTNTRFSLNGLTDDQIRFALDDVPLELAGFTEGLAYVPFFMLERVVVYRGVVPIRFGADALGGLVNLVSSFPSEGYGAGASYQVGSFGTHRLAAYGYNVHKPTGLFTRLNLFGDFARNDYRHDAPVTDDYQFKRVKRFHDGYRGYGGAFEIGVVKRPWAQRLILRTFGTRIAKELQHSPVDITVPYGEAKFRRGDYGATLRYEQPLGHGLRIEALLGYAYQPTRFRDESNWIYNWYGERVRPDSNPGESSSAPIDQSVREHLGFMRTLLSWRIADGHKVELLLSPSYARRRGEDHRVTMGRDPLADTRRLWTLVSALSYELNLFDDLVENTLFAKSYVYRTHADDTAPNGTKLNRDAEINRFGAGDALRVRITRDLYSKLSYELATRLPRPFEVFGDGVFTIPNLELKPETSHNANLEVTLERETERAGRYRASLNGFLRAVDQQIVRIGFRRTDVRFENVYKAHGLGAEGSAGWTSPGNYFELDGNLTYVDLRNASSNGPFGMYKGDRIPNRPYLYANTSTRAMWPRLFTSTDELSLTWYMRYVHSFYRFWESAGARDTKLEVPDQWSHALVLAYQVKLDRLLLSGAAEAQNLADATLYDDFGIPRPGRAYYMKVTAQY